MGISTEEFQVKDSKFKLWRAIISIIHLDDHVSPAERKWVEERIANLPLNNDQRDQLKKDLERPYDLLEAFANIETKADRAFFLHQIRVLGHIDGDFSSQERLAFSKIQDTIEQNIDLTPLIDQVKEMEEQSYHEDNVYETVNKNSMFERFVNGMKKVANPGDFVEPKKK